MCVYMCLVCIAQDEILYTLYKRAYLDENSVNVNSLLPLPHCRFDAVAVKQGIKQVLFQRSV